MTELPEAEEEEEERRPPFSLFSSACTALIQVGDRGHKHVHTQTDKELVPVLCVCPNSIPLVPPSMLFQSLMSSHDTVAQRDYIPKLPEVPFEVDEDEETIKMVQLVKSQDAVRKDLLS